MKAAVQDTHDSRVAKAFNTYNTRSDSLTATTGFADHLFFTQSRQNILLLSGHRPDDLSGGIAELYAGSENPALRGIFRA